VRFGTEGADNDNWCEPNIPRHWNGRVLVSRHENVESAAEDKPKKLYKCQWGDALPTQCFGLGPEKTTLNPHEMSHFTGRYTFLFVHNFTLRQGHFLCLLL
jgi:hypothetical protein